jgi:large subunit ribosomal protein L4
MKADLYNQKAERVGEVELPDSVFGLKWNGDLVHQAYRVSLSASRKILAHTKDRGEVRGGGKKPWAQKGTGRARHGSIRSPLWRGGGVTHGPSKDRNFKLALPKKMRKKAVAVLLSEKARKGRLIILDEIFLPEPKTKYAAAILVGFRTGKKRQESALILAAGSSLAFRRAFRNIPKTKMFNASDIGVLDLLRHGKVFLLKEAIPSLEKNLALA